jgi:uncharacterized membrane protein (UPF0127 family)
MKRRLSFAMAALLAPTVLIPAAIARTRLVTAAQTAQTVPLSIATRHGRRNFRVEVAATPAQQERGLMFRTVLAPGAGMIFPMSPARPATFWMKNTLIPLDMIFVREDGTIARVAANTKPETLDLVDSGEPVIAVLEIAGGEAAKQGIAAGDRVRWPGGPTG